MQSRLDFAIIAVENSRRGDESMTYVIKVNGKTSGFEPGDESEHLALP